MLQHDVYRYSPEDDPGGRRGKTFFSAVFEVERLEAVRAFVGRLLVVVGVPCWIMAAWPGLMPGLPRRLALALWASLFLVFVYHLAALWRWRRILAGFSASATAERDRTATPRARLEESRAALQTAASHELRSPLAVITGAATTLRDGAEVPAATRAELLDSICDQAGRLDLAVANVLDVLGLRSSTNVKREWVACEELVGAALERVEKRRGERPVELQIPPDLPLLRLDPALCERLIANLIDVAAQRGPAGAATDIRARSLATGVELLVADRGPALPPGELDGDLRLIVASRIAAALGGTFAVEPREAGGTRYLLTFPPADQPAPPSDAEPAPPARRAQA